MVWKMYIPDVEYLWTTGPGKAQLLEVLDEDGQFFGYIIFDPSGHPLTIEIEELHDYAVKKMMEAGVKIVTQKEWEENLKRKLLRPDRNKD